MVDVFEIQLSISYQHLTAVELILENLGALSITLQDAENSPLYIENLDETPVWKQIALSALFDKDFKLRDLHRTLERTLTCQIELTKHIVDDEGYIDKWKKEFPPIRLGERLWICPSWCSSPDPFAVNVRLDPGLAFGTGTHPTTSLCLEWLATHSPLYQTVVDFGCGSGILAIAAYYLGAKIVYAIDHDTQATQATRANAKKNSVPAHRIITSTASGPTAHSCDLLIANILLRPLLNLEKQFANCVKPTGKIILSGILESQAEELIQTYMKNFTIDQIYIKNEWLLVEASRN